MLLNHKRYHQSPWLQRKTNDSLSTKHDVTMKPVHDINHTSNVSPEYKATSKAEYTNTQQDLPVNWYNLVHLTRHARLFGCRGLFCRKATNSRSLLSDFSFHDSSSINHSRWASISKQACWNKHSKYFYIIIIIFHLLLYVAKMLSSLIDRERRPIRIEFLTLQGKPNTHVWGTKSPTQHFPFLSGSWTGSPTSTTGYDYPALACWPHENDVQCSKRVRVKSTPRSNQILCLPITIFLGMWLVRSNA